MWRIRSVLRLLNSHGKCRFFSEETNKLQRNVILMGSPGSGKTSVGARLARVTGKAALDIDNDFLEHHWQMPVSQKLAEVGGDAFIDEEGKALLQFVASDSIVSLTGSNPMHKEAMEYIRSTGLVVFLDVEHNGIVSRLEKMKVNRIVGQETGTPMLDILKFRQQFYEQNYDVRVICEPNESLESVTSKVAEAVNTYMHNTGHKSTRSNQSDSQNITSKSFNEVVIEGLAEDGGLYVPIFPIPKLTINQWHRLKYLPFEEKALRILEKWIHPKSLSTFKLKEILSSVYSSNNFNNKDVVPVKHLEGNQYIAELFHGPTASFKDLALQLLPHFFENALRERLSTNSDLQRFLILVATSGDTGGAVLDGFSKYGGKHTSVMVLYPEEGISSIQKMQMTSMQGNNVHVVGVRNDFDFCQTAIKSIFRSKDINAMLKNKYSCNLSAANSLNWGRLIPQTVYHACAYISLVENGVIGMGDVVDLCIPTGNFGNVLAAFYAKKMGIPFRRFIIASNKNNVLTDFIKAGTYDLRNRELHLTSSPAIDILKSSNLERLLYHVSDGDSDLVNRCFEQLDTKRHFSVPREILVKIQKHFVADWCSEEECLRAIERTYNEKGYMLDTHTAVAKTLADRFNQNDCPMVIASTAHYAKFADSALQALTGQTQFEQTSPSKMFTALEGLNPIPEMHPVLKESAKKPRIHQRVCDPTIEAVVHEIEYFLARKD